MGIKREKMDGGSDGAGEIGSEPGTPAQKVQVKAGRKWKDVDTTLYDVTFINNVKKGKATVLVNATGGKTSGSKTATFTIGTRNFSLFGLL